MSFFDPLNPYDFAVAKIDNANKRGAPSLYVSTWRTALEASKLIDDADGMLSIALQADRWQPDPGAVVDPVVGGSIGNLRRRTVDNVAIDVVSNTYETASNAVDIAVDATEVLKETSESASSTTRSISEDVKAGRSLPASIFGRAPGWVWAVGGFAAVLLALVVLHEVRVAYQTVRRAA